MTRWKVFVSLNTDSPDTDEIAYRVEAESIMDAIADVQSRHLRGAITKAMTHEAWKQERDHLRQLRSAARQAT